MLVYIYQASLLCETCGAHVRAELTKAGHAPEDPEDEGSFDSNDFPKGPTEEGESDSPSHCEACHVFLESTLTEAGTDYVRDAIEAAIVRGDRGSAALTTWRDYYGIEARS